MSTCLAAALYKSPYLPAERVSSQTRVHLRRYSPEFGAAACCEFANSLAVTYLGVDCWLEIQLQGPWADHGYHRSARSRAGQSVLWSKRSQQHSDKNSRAQGGRLCTRCVAQVVGQWQDAGPFTGPSNTGSFPRADASLGLTECRR